MAKKLYDQNQKNGAVKTYKVIDGQIVEVKPAADANHLPETVTATTRTLRPAGDYKRKHGRCEDAPCCGCCD